MKDLEMRVRMDKRREADLSVQEMSLDRESAQSLRDALRENSLSSDNISEREIFEAGAKLKDKVPVHLQQALTGMAVKNSRQAVLLIRGLPIERPAGKTKAGHGSEALLAAIGSFLGQPFLAEGHREGRHFLNLIPKESDAKKELGTGTELQWHSEDAQLSSPPRFICLLGLRGSKEAQTLISKTQIDSLDSELVSLLSQPLYTFTSDESYGAAHEEVGPVISRDDTDAYRLRYDVKFTTFKSPDGARAYESLRRVFEEKNTSFCVDTGDLLVFNNKLAAHRRSMFKPSFTDDDRWVQRLMMA